MLGFILFTIVGTLSHEAGHYVMATKYFNNPSLHYGYVNYGEWKELEGDPNWFYNRCDEGGKILPQYEDQYNQLLELNQKQVFFTTLGGPLQTILFGTIGFLCLLFRKKKTFAVVDWLLVFLAFFWSREVYMIVFLAFDWLTAGSASSAGDEVKLTYYLQWHPLGVAMLLGSIGTAVLGYVVFVKIPLNQRFTFLISGFVGSIIGFWFWLDFLGPIVLP